MTRAKKSGTKRNARQIALAGKTVTLDDGRRVKIKPWGMDKREDLLPILANLTEEIMAAGKELATLTIPTFLLRFTDQVDDMVQITIGWDDAQMHEITLGDSFRLTNAVMSVCIIGEDGGGPLGEFLRLYVVGNEMLRTVLSPTTDELREAMELEPRTTLATPSPRSSKAVRRLSRSADTRQN